MDALKRLVFPGYPGGRTGAAMLVLRILVGVAFMFHGYGKIQDPFGWMGPTATMPGPLQAAAAVSEFFGGMVLIVGLLTPLACAGLFCTMVVAVNIHVSRGDPFVGKGGSWELAANYLVATLVLLLIGPGRFSLDARIFGRGDNE